MVEPIQVTISPAFIHRLLAFCHYSHTTGNPDARHLNYYECRECGGTDEEREERKPSFASVKHAEHCEAAILLAHHLQKDTGNG